MTPVSLFQVDLRGFGPYAVLSRPLDDLAAVGDWVVEESWDDLDTFEAVVLDAGPAGLAVLLQYRGQPPGTSNLWLLEAQPEASERRLLAGMLGVTGLTAGDVQWRRTPAQTEPATLAQAV